jgi:protein-S-isoprenylcysteine O-methyltransferase Ste14
MISIGNFFFKYRNLLFPIFGLSIFIPSPPLFSPETFGDNYYMIPLVLGLFIAFSGQLIRALTIALKYIVRGGKDKKVYANDLVTEGIFNHCRNPLYVGNILMLLGVGLLSNSLYFIVFVVPVFCFIYQAIVLAEENYLRGKFGPQYDVYASQVNRWIPRLQGLGTTLNSMTFNWKRYVSNEYNTVYLLCLSIYLVLVTHHPELVKMTRDEKIRLSITVIGVLSAIYLFVRYLKKSKKLVTNQA